MTQTFNLWENTPGMCEEVPVDLSWDSFAHQKTVIAVHQNALSINT